MTGFDAFLTYQALHLHFSSPTYNYFKYKGKTNCTVARFEVRRDRYFFHKLARKFSTKEELEFFLAANFVSHGISWIRDAFSEDADETYLKRKRVKESLEYVVCEDLNALFGNSVNRGILKLSLQVVRGEFPMLLTAMTHGTIHEETVIVLNALIQFLPKWEAKITDTILFPPLKLKLERYAPFLEIDVKNFSHILKSQLTVC